MLSMLKLLRSSGKYRQDSCPSGLRLCFHYLLWVLLLVGTSRAVTSAEPLALHPKNPHYFLFRGKPAILVTSGEH
jgi:hypothetical protein